ncbi:glutaminyl-peptide cyclotransferase isoform X1 [Penaeus vannamei]|uniref:glutaminyl-peptide cyclotransferase isoform X1 n=1 Tax=Penaeus vannamei TaxID=6689 RepID=UPI000F68004A|nr:glutaminyl-peptide cyclotransferase-like isoform X1 [Penaeus vannamei]
MQVVLPSGRMLPRWSCVALLYTLATLNGIHGEEKCEKRSRAVWYNARTEHEGMGLSDAELRKIGALTDMNYFRKVLNPILVPRVVGTESHARVREHLINTMQNLGWAIEEDQFANNTPIGRKNFTNVVATLDPEAPRRLVLACHYDSKLDREGVFVGATDSAVPCAMMLHLAKVLGKSLDDFRQTCKKKRGKPGKKCRKSVLKKKLRKLKSFTKGIENTEASNMTTEPQVPRKCLWQIRCCAMPMKNFKLSFVPLVQSDLTLQFLFFDGEEAFRRWSKTDSLYGARNLAAKWQQSLYPEGNRDGTNHLHRIDLFVLLDLIGTEDVRFFSYFPETDSWYTRLVSYEQRLNDLGILNRRRFMFEQQRLYNSHIEDDHIPFLERGVPIVHVIPVPFPSVWHKNTDNESALHYPTIKNFNTIISAFVADYLHLVL